MTNHLNSKNEVDLNFYELFHIIWKGRYRAVYIAVFFIIISFIYAVSLPNMYKSEATLATVDRSFGSSLSSPVSSGIAGFAGINFSSGLDNGAEEGIEIMKSLSFFTTMSDEYNLLADIYAVKGWDEKTRSLIYDSTIYDSASKKWIGSEGKKQSKPSYQEAYDKFNEIFSVETDRNTGFIKVSAISYSPDLSKKLVDLSIDHINKLSREAETEKALKSIEYLNRQIQLTELSEVRQALSSLVQSETETLLLAKASPDFLFKVLDPAFSKKKKVSPSRVMIVLFGVFLGIVVGIFYIFLNNMRVKNE